MHILQRRHVRVSEGKRIIGIDIKIVGEALMSIIVGIGGNQNENSFTELHIQFGLHSIIDQVFINGLSFK